MAGPKLKPRFSHCNICAFPAAQYLPCLSTLKVQTGKPPLGLQ